MDIQYIGDGKAPNKKIKYWDEHTYEKKELLIQFKDVGGKQIARNVPEQAGERLLKSENFVEYKK